jgi:hypothetical protein
MIGVDLETVLDKDLQLTAHSVSEDKTGNFYKLHK